MFETCFPSLGPRSKPIDLESLLRQPLIVPETMPVADLLAAFRDQGIRFAVVVDEYGGTAGIASAEDVLSELVGELETPESDGIEVHDSYIEVEGWVHDELNDRFELDIPEDDDYETVAGYLLAALGRVPDARESYTRGAGRTLQHHPRHTHHHRADSNSSKHHRARRMKSRLNCLSVRPPSPLVITKVATRPVSMGAGKNTMSCGP